MTGQEFARKAKAEKLYDKAKKTLCGTSDGSIFIDSDLGEIESQAKKDGLQFYVLKGTVKKETKEKPVIEQ